MVVGALFGWMLAFVVSIPFAFADVRLNGSEIWVLVGATVMRIYLDARPILQLRLPGARGEPPIEIENVPTDSVTLPVALLVPAGPAALATVLSSLAGYVINPIRSVQDRWIRLSYMVGSASAAGLGVLVTANAVSLPQPASALDVVRAAVAASALLTVLGFAFAWPSIRAHGQRMRVGRFLWIAPLQACIATVLLLLYDAEDLVPAGIGVVLVVVLSEGMYRLARSRSELRARDEERDRLLGMVVESGDAERLAMASALHDGPLQELLALKMRVEDSTRGDGDGIAASLGDTAEHLRELLLRAAPLQLLEGGLAGALQRDLDAFGATFSAGIELRCDLPSPVGREAELAAYQIIHEAVVNAHRHGLASRVEVSVVAKEGQLSVRVHDDGAGADAVTASAAWERGHLGLAMMRERAELAGGSFTFQSALGEGTTVAAELPLLDSGTRRGAGKR